MGVTHKNELPTNWGTWVLPVSLIGAFAGLGWGTILEAKVAMIVHLMLLLCKIKYKKVCDNWEN